MEKNKQGVKTMEKKPSKVWKQWKRTSKVFHLDKDVTLGIQSQADW